MVSVSISKLPLSPIPPPAARTGGKGEAANNGGDNGDNDDDDVVVVVIFDILAMSLLASVELASSWLCWLLS
jgi:hypothetical protein